MGQAANPHDDENPHIITCWDSTLGKPDAVEVATTGQWANQPFGLNGGSPNFNHAKIGISIAGQHR
jgi:hypothetical protein